MPKVFIRTYGCTLNQADSDILRALLKEKYQIVDNEEESDVIILNTCTVKGATENKIFEYIKTLRKSNKKFVVAGCISANEKKIRRFAPLAPIITPSSLKSICDAVNDALLQNPSFYNVFQSKELLPKTFSSPIMRIPINDGCVSSCHYCQTKFARPFLHSYSPKTIVKWINKSVNNGAREIQLTSMDSGAYGLDLKTNLIKLLEAIISDTKTDERFLVRLGMINPDHAKRMLPDIISKLKHGRFYKFLHIPVQTGSEKVCKEMNRDHTIKDFIDIVKVLRLNIPEVSIATDIIVGYPTETEEDFQQTLNLLKEIEPDTTNVSKFSPRPGTKAKELTQLHNDEIKRRSKETSELVRKISEKRRKMYIGKEYEVLITEKSPDFKGRNINYQQVVVRNFKGKLGDFVTVKIADANHGSLFGIQ
ncbi:tRNA (N(6)-L-threonylcarbamoyladenosine(37)-C(2))-methylthiotransferase [Candidatus Micrarchaeota archaeon]|nr:tRNA (N(6)-L-threonylcarbamoyladenosine(37)-C(2))-methylthiotransferase [Candidatus Micrarchaeota archaeon]